MARIGLFFGSFNPVHIGHLSIANYIWQNTDIDEVWMVISPHNPFKESSELWDVNLRLKLLRQALGDHQNIKICTIELDLPKPSFTFRTLEALKDEYPQHNFALITGEDIVDDVRRWKNGDKIIDDNEFLIYPRKTQIDVKFDLQNFQLVDAPRLDISSTYIRKCLAEGKDIRYLVGKDVAKLIAEVKFV